MAGSINAPVISTLLPSKAVVSRGHMDAGVKEMHDSREGGIRTEEAKAEDAEAAFCFSL